MRGVCDSNDGVYDSNDGPENAERMKQSMDLMSKGINPKRQNDKLLAQAKRLQVRHRLCHICACVHACARARVSATLTHTIAITNRLRRKLRSTFSRSSRPRSTGSSRAGARKRSSWPRPPCRRQLRGTTTHFLLRCPIRFPLSCPFRTRWMSWQAHQQGEEGEEEGEER